jgi:curli biogenesis system outer membrane secretion channel CsgG
MTTREINGFSPFRLTFGPELAAVAGMDVPHDTQELTPELPPEASQILNIQQNGSERRVLCRRLDDHSDVTSCPKRAYNPAGSNMSWQATRIPQVCESGAGSRDQWWRRLPMRKLGTLCVLVLVTSLALQAADARKKRVAVLDFEYGTVKSASDAMFGQSVDVGKGMCDLLVKHLVKDGTYSVIERRALDKILAEQNFSTSDRANPASAAKIGKILGVDAIIIGTVTQFGAETKKTGVGGSGGNWSGFGIGGLGHSKSKAIVTVDARVVDVDTGEILVASDGKGESSRSSTSLLGGGSNWHGFGSGNVDFGTSDFENTIIGEAVKQAMEGLSSGLIAGAPKLQTRTIAVQALVAFADASSVVLNVGAKSGLKVGDKLTVERVKQEIKDPGTGQVLRRLTTPIGNIEVSEVDEISAVCKIVSGTGFKVGDMAKTLTQ